MLNLLKTLLKGSKTTSNADLEKPRRIIEQDEFDRRIKNGDRDFSHCTLHVSFAGLVLRGYNFRGSDFRFAKDLHDSSISLAASDLSETIFDGMNLNGIDMTDANLNGAQFINANLVNASLANAQLNGANLTGANLVWADLSGTQMAWTIMEGANLQKADLYNSSITRIKGKFHNARLPDGFSLT